MSKISAYTKMTILEFGKHRSKFLYQVPDSYLEWYFNTNIEWWEMVKLRRNRLEVITSNPALAQKYLLMEYIENNLVV